MGMLHAVAERSELRGKRKELLRDTVVNHLAEVTPEPLGDRSTGSQLRRRFLCGLGADDPPNAGTYHLTSQSSPVFKQVQSISELGGRLTGTTGSSAAVCSSSCESEVQGDSEKGAFTAFKVGDVFYRNIESTVQLKGVPQFFRNPPVYLKEFLQRGAQEAIHNEVDVLLKHWVRHGNTGRLTPHTRGTVLSAYNSARDGTKRQAAGEQS